MSIVSVSAVHGFRKGKPGERERRDKFSTHNSEQRTVDLIPTSSVLRNPRGISRGPQPRPYSPEYGAAPFPNGTRAHRCAAGPLARGMRKSHRAIRSFCSITVLRKRSERRALRRGPPEATGRENKAQWQTAKTQDWTGIRIATAGVRTGFAMTGTGVCPLRRGREFGRRLFRSCGSDLLSQRGERRQRRARGTIP